MCDSLCRCSSLIPPACHSKGKVGLKCNPFSTHECDKIPKMKQKLDRFEMFLTKYVLKLSSLVPVLNLFYFNFLLKNLSNRTTPRILYWFWPAKPADPSVMPPPRLSRLPYALAGARTKHLTAQL